MVPYICVEGNDGSGKDSQVDMLVTRMIAQGLDPVRVAEPCEDLPHGRLLRELLSSGKYPASHAALFLADRIALQEAIVVPALTAGRPVISVRSFLSTLAYQEENGWSLSWLLDLHRQMLALPNVLIYLDVDPQTSFKRIGRRALRKEHYERMDIQVRNRGRYKYLLGGGEGTEELLTLFPMHPTIITVDGNSPRVVVHDQIWKGLETAGFV